jgi:hypothetical protein
VYPRKSKLTCSEFPGRFASAVHDPGLVGVQFETEGPEPPGDAGQHLLGLGFAVAVDDDVIRVTLERAVRVFPVYPTVERVVHEQVG